MRLVIAGGGTGGHIFAGVAIAQEFMSQGKGHEALFVGSQYGLETRLVPKWGFALETIRVGKLVGQNPLRRLLTLAQIPIAIFKCARILKRFKADMIIGVGGFAAGPCIVAGRLLGLPIGVLEQNSVMGFTNRVSARLAHHVFTAFEGVPKGVPAPKCVFTGNPTRSQMREAGEKPAKPFVVFAFGGSQGATGINKLLTEAAQHLHPRRADIEIIHQTGERDHHWVAEAYEKLGYPAQVHKFIDDMQSMYDRASIVLCRAGSGTIAELGATRNAAIFIPFPYAAQNHQEHNARAVEKAGAAKVLPQAKSSGGELAQMILDLRANPLELEKMREAMKKFHIPDSARRIVEIMKTRALTAGR